MKPMLNAVRGALVTLAVGLSLAACAHGPAATADPAAQIGVLIGDAACSSDDDCATIGIGARACGGPQAYAAWSRKGTDAQALTQAVARHRAERQRQIERNGEQSICSIVSDPGARCARTAPGAPGRCELRSTGGGAGSPALR